MNDLAAALALLESQRKRQIRRAAVACSLMTVFWASSYSSLTWMILVDGLGQTPRVSFSKLFGLAVAGGLACGMPLLVVAWQRTNRRVATLRSQMIACERRAAAAYAVARQPGPASRATPTPRFCSQCGASHGAMVARNHDESPPDAQVQVLTHTIARNGPVREYELAGMEVA